MELNEELRRRITAAGQEQVLRFWEELDEAGREHLAAQLAEINWEKLPEWAAEYVLQKPQTAIPSQLEAPEYYPAVPGDFYTRALYEKAVAAGEELLRSGKVSGITVAGGQGTRLGFDGPKGTYPIGPVTGRTLFSYFAGAVARAGEKYGHPITWYIMTSPINREATENYFRAENFFGLEPQQVVFFTQGTMPAFGTDGKLLLSAKDSLALSPDGHGGTLLALRKSGALDRMAAEGAEYLSYWQVDNPLVQMFSPLFLGLHALDKSEMSAIMLAKNAPKEKLGNFCRSAGKLQIIEYSDLPDELAEKRRADGTLEFLAGSPAIHVLSRTFIERLTAGGSLQLPWHRADKKIPCLDAAGNPVTPEAPNGVKLESFIFDALPLAERTMLLEGVRSEVFAPTKNAVGVDSAESCRQLLTARNARRLAACGVEIPRNADGSAAAEIEISPRTVLDDADAAELVRTIGLKAVCRGQKLAL